MLKKVLVLAMALVMSCVCLGACSGAQQASSSSSSLQDAKYAVRDTSLLEGPDAEAKVLAKVSIGKAAKLVGTDGDYSKVRALGKEGYILTADLVDSESDVKAAKAAAEEAEKAAAEEAAKAAAEAAAQAEAEEKARAEAEEQARIEAEETARAQAQAQEQAQAQAQAAAAAQAQAEAEAAAAAAAAEQAKQPTIVSKEYVPPCDGHADGYTVIIYSDGTEALVEGKA